MSKETIEIQDIRSDETEENCDKTSEEIHDDDYYFDLVFKQAKLALAEGEVPVGCVFVDNNKIICEGRNSTNQRLTGEAHAEMKCIDEVLLKYPDINWNNVIVYVSVEPCIMCASALKILGVKKILFGCHNPRFGGISTVLNAPELCCNCPPPEIQSSSKWNDLAINILKQFYGGTNPSAPEHKQKFKKLKTQ